MQGDSAKAVEFNKMNLHVHFDEIFQAEHNIDKKMYNLAHQLSI